MIKGNAASLISHIRDAVNKLIISELEKHGVEGIVPSHGDILLCLYKHDNVTMKELAEYIHRTKPTVTVLVNKLVACGYVIREKDVNDNRITYIKLTQRGMELQPIFKAVSNRIREMMYGGLSEAEGELLENLLEKVLQRF
ncbi:MarR family winged helix-turn-helix transcriptional regulator [Brevibacillus sp. DP1.3A]|uniref:MarR family winged helix-turn-helix transcriptional regulator n=1 Tax=Brevibacillus sp. DP1.3A TaxID=2738867 RepID=UPI00156AB61F|nr:MarR family transcriptional regulator [Brevibacillus sp. DP1.3A]UED77698.1 MarR family transcriptional regulator [Brevibacillus sp. DP1.3A]